MDIFNITFKLPGDQETRNEKVEAESEQEARSIVETRHKPSEIVSVERDNA
ncbi:hypothetical protein [Salinicola aestuarinus]|uniref:hypothetical protein n=1 Tax=Salinicola aestuarinus TaxID=1949082 RepID=UPI0013001A28|nr:hypothetical protein [Salinicola aestuarinus]